MSDLKLTADDTAIIAALNNIEKKLGEVGAAAVETQKDINKSFAGDDAARAAASLDAYKAAQEKLKASTQDRIAVNAKMREGLATYRKEQEVLNAATAEGAQKNVEMAGALKDTAGGLNAGANAAKGATAATQGATLAQRAFNFVMSLNPIGLVIAALVLLVNQFRKYQGVIDAVSKFTAQLGAVFTVVTDRVISLGKAVYSLVTLDWAGFGKNSMDAITGFGDAVSNAWVETGKLEDQTNALRDAQLQAALSTAKLTAASEKAQAAAADESRSFNDRIKSLKQAAAIEAEIAKIKVGFAEKDAQIERGRFALSKKTVADTEALLEKEIALQDIRNGADKTRISLIQQLNALEKERTEFIAKNLEDVTKLIDKLDIDLTQDPTDKKIEQINQGVEQQIKAIEEGIKKIAEVEALRPLSAGEIAQRQDLQDKIVGVIEKGEKDKIDAILEGARKAQDLEDKIREDKKKAEKLKGDEAKEALKNIKDLQDQKISITEAEFDNFIASLKAAGAKEEDIKQAQNDFSKRIQAERLQADLDYQKGLLSLAGNGVEAEIIKARIQELQVILDGIDIPAPKSKKGKGKALSIFDVLGIKFDDPETERAITESISVIIDSLGQLTQARVDEAEAAVNAAEDRVQAAEDALRKEEDLAKEGLANNVDIKKKELAAAKSARDIALKEEEKAKKQQIALDSAVQLSSLITTAANIFKGFSTLPIIGQVLGVISVAAMFASFAAAKSSALKAASPKLRKGRKFDGPTHEQGNEDMVFDGRRTFAVEKDEWLIGTEHSREHDTFLANMNRGKYKGMNLAAMAERKSDYQSPLTDAAARTERLTGRRAQAQEAQHFNVLAKTYERVGQQIVGAIQDKPDIYPWKGGYKEVKKGGSVTSKKTVLPASE